MTKKKGKKNKESNEEQQSTCHQAEKDLKRVFPIKIRCGERQSKSELSSQSFQSFKHEAVLRLSGNGLLIRDKQGLLLSKDFALWCRFESEVTTEKLSTSLKYRSQSSASNSQIMIGSISNRFFQKLLEVSVSDDGDGTNYGDLGSNGSPTSPMITHTPNSKVEGRLKSHQIVSTPSSPFTFQSPKKDGSPYTLKGISSTSSSFIDAYIVGKKFIPNDFIKIASNVEIQCNDLQKYCRTINDHVSLLALARSVLHDARVRLGDIIHVPFKGIDLSCTISHVDFTNVRFQSGKNNESTIYQDLDTVMQSCTLDNDCFDAVNELIGELFPEKNYPILCEINQMTSIKFQKMHGENYEHFMFNMNLASDSQAFTAGLDDERQKIISALRPSLLTPSIFSKVNNGTLRPPKGVLLFGPSGVGKTTLAREICHEILKINAENMSKEVSKVLFQWVECGSMISSVVGRAERQLSMLFDTAEKQAITGKSTLIVFDNVELLCPRRGGPIASATTDRCAATLLALLDGIGDYNSNLLESLVSNTPSRLRGNVAILAITSRPSVLDPALRRAGRLDFEVEISIPDEENRAKIIEMQIEQLVSRDRVPGLCSDKLKLLSRKAKGFTGADTLLAIKDAMRHSLVEFLGDEDEFVVRLGVLEHSISRTNPSSIRDIVIEVPSVKWDDIGGMNDVKMLLKEAIEFPVIYSHFYKALNIRPAKGVLLYGPPGCSKTLMARALATEGQMNFLAVKGPELLSKWLGESERALASLFRRARQASPSVIFFDEIDAIASKRGGADSGSSGDRLLSQLLTELDGISPLKRVVIVGATNRPDLLDNALTRPGRIDRKVYVGVPDYESRKGILEIGLKGKSCANDLDVTELAKECHTGGYSGAEMISLCREAALRAIEEDDEIGTGAPVIAMKHMLKAVSETKRQITPDLLKFYSQLKV